MPRILLAALFLGSTFATAQSSFNTRMPDGVPAVTGTPVENLTMHWIDITIGSGAAAAPGKQYTVHYTGWLRDGKKFDSSVDRGEPLKFVQGRRQLIAGWEVGFEGMKVGGKRRLFLPYQLAYGEAGRGQIPPKAELIFDVELLDVSDAPAIADSAEVLLSLSDSERKVLALAQAVPAEKYSWRPGSGVRSFGEVFLHIAYGNKLMLDLSGGPPPQEELNKRIAQQLQDEKKVETKERIIEMLTESFATVRKAVEGMRTAALARDTQFFGTTTTRRGVLILLDAHVAEHLGQAIAYARVNGIVPPWSR
jgi:peptidylprolyl isomerase